MDREQIVNLYAEGNSDESVEEIATRFISHGFKREAISFLMKSLTNTAYDNQEASKDSIQRLIQFCNLNYTVIANHQPNYFPWLGYFHKIYYSDKFVFLDDVQIGQRSRVNRVFVRSKVDKSYLRIPLKKHHRTDLIKDVYPSGSDWKDNNLSLLRYYKEYPYFKTYFSQIEALIENCDVAQPLSEVNIAMIKGICNILNIETPFIKSSELDIQTRKTQLMIDITKSQGGNIYLSGTGARKYQSNSEFQAANISLVYQDLYKFIERFNYQQHQEKMFVNGLSIIDVLFSIGVDGILRIFHGYEEITNILQS